MWWPRSCSCAQLVELHRVAEVQVRPGRVEAFLDPERLPARKLGDELAFDEQLVGAALEHGKLVIDVDGHGGRGEERNGRDGRDGGAPGCRRGVC